MMWHCATCSNAFPASLQFFETLKRLAALLYISAAASYLFSPLRKLVHELSRFSALTSRSWALASCEAAM